MIIEFKTKKEYPFRKAVRKLEVPNIGEKDFNCQFSVTDVTKIKPIYAAKPNNGNILYEFYEVRYTEIDEVDPLVYTDIVAVPVKFEPQFDIKFDDKTREFVVTTNNIEITRIADCEEAIDLVEGKMKMLEKGITMWDLVDSLTIML